MSNTKRGISMQCLINMWLVFIACELTQDTSGDKRKIIIEWTRIDCSYRDPEFLTDGGCLLNRVSKTRTAFSLYLVLAKDIHQMNGSYRIAVERMGRYVEYLKLDLDFCTTLGQIQTNPFFEFVAREIRAVSNFPLTCPFKKNFRYEVKNFTVTAAMLPPYVPALSWATSADYWSSGKKGFVLNCFGAIKRK